MPEESLRRNLDILQELSQRAGKRSALFITNYQTEESVCLLHDIKESANHVYGYLEINHESDLISALKYADGRVDTVLADIHLAKSLLGRDSIAVLFGGGRRRSRMFCRARVAISWPQCYGGRAVDPTWA